MKNAFAALLFACGMGLSPLAAQEKPPQVGVFVSGGNAFLARGGAADRITRPLQLQSGVQVLPDGTVALPNGRRTRLRPGQFLGSDGKIVVLETRGVSRGLAVRSLEGILMVGGRAHVVHAGRVTRLGSAFPLTSGVVIDPMGRMRMPDGTMSQLGNGQLLTYSGQIRNPGNNPAGNAPVASYPRPPNSPTDVSTQATYTGEVAPNPAVLPGEGTEAR